MLLLTTLTVIHFSMATYDVKHYQIEVKPEECAAIAKEIKAKVKAGRVFLFCGRRQI